MCGMSAVGSRKAKGVAPSPLDQRIVFRWLSGAGVVVSGGPSGVYRVVVEALADKNNIGDAKVPRQSNGSWGQSRKESSWRWVSIGLAVDGHATPDGVAPPK